MNPTERLYTPKFFQVLLSTALTMVGVSMQYHFGEFVAYRGYSEATLGWVTGIAALGSLLLRPYAGSWIDRVGCRASLLGSGLCGAAANFLFQFTDSLTAICLLRIIMVASNATFLATVAVFAARIAPFPRRAESLGSIGIGGFLGMMTGPLIGDLIFAHARDLPQAFRFFFTAVAAANLLAAIVVINLQAPDLHPSPGGPGFFRLIRQHWPGSILLVATIFTAALTIHMSFLERYAHFRGFEDIRWFFLVYAPTAITLRLLCRRFPERFGRPRVCIAGLTGMAIGMVCFIFVRQQWHLVLPALLMGAGHAFVFPSMVDLAADALPTEHRGMGTSIVLGAGDVGILFGGIAWGQLIERAGWEPTFILIAVLMWFAAGLYTWRHRAAAVSPAGKPAHSALP